jgi:hypothetical protein
MWITTVDIIQRQYNIQVNELKHVKLLAQVMNILPQFKIFQKKKSLSTMLDQ